MKVLMISDEESNGGAAISASNLADGLVGNGNDVLRLVIFPNFRQDNRWRTQHFWNRKTWMEKAFAKSVPLLPGNLKNFFAGRNIRRILHKEKPDVVNFHNILWGIDQGYDLSMYKIAASGCPTFITMHDMWNIIGYPYDLEQIKDKRILDNWQIPAEHLKGHTKEQVANLRKAIFKNENIYFIAPSNWLKHELIQKYPFTEKRIFVIPYGIDTEIFKPGDKKKLKQSLSIPDNKINILASAASLEHVNKGFHILVSVLQQRINADIRLLLMGDDRIMKQLSLPAGLEVISFGYVNNDLEKANIYNASDVLAFPSFGDNLPNSVIESISCGTPVIAFNTCGLPDLVKKNQTGWLSETVNIDCYRQSFENAIMDLKNGIDLSITCRDFALKNFTINKQAKAYEKLFRGEGIFGKN